MSTPITTLTLYRTELAMDNIVMDVNSHLSHLARSEQYTVQNCTFQRQDYEMRLPLSMDIAGRYNYASFVNNGRTFYCFISEMEYVNDNMTKANYTMDWWHTYQSDIVYKPTMIERKIVKKSEDDLGRFTADEPVSVATYNTVNTWSNYTGTSSAGDLDYWYLIVDNGLGVFNPPDHTYGGFTYYGNVTLSDAASSVQARLASLTRVDQTESLQGIWMLPKSVFGASGDIVSQPQSASQPIGLMIPTTIDGYTIKNNKTRTSPFMIVNVFSSDGDDITLRIQDIIASVGADTVIFVTTAGLFPEPSASIRPWYVFKQENSYGLMSLLCKHFPVPNISSAGITIKDAINMISSGVSLGAGVAYQSASRALTRANMEALAESHRDKETGRGGFLTKIERKRADALYDLNSAQTLGNVGGGVTNAASAISSVQSAKGVKGGGTGAEMARGEVGFVIMIMAPDTEQLIEIDNFFTRYGYAINQIENVELDNRTMWDYVKTKDACFSVPTAPIEAQNAINAMFNSGLTLFHTGVLFKRFDSANL